jgi:hypothetical protein
MQPLNLPPCQVRLSKKNGKTYIFDPLRRKEVVLSPEEWVRQHFVQFLIASKSYPPERIANEVSIHVNATVKRCDTIVYDSYLSPLAIIEYKAPEVIITSDVFDQISCYNSALRVPYLMISNGLKHYCCHLDYRTMSYRFLEDIPAFGDL